MSQPRQVYTLELPAAPERPDLKGIGGTTGRVPIHNVSGRTLRLLHRHGLIEYPDGEDSEPIRLTAAGDQLAWPDRRRAELAGIAAVR